jgi:2-methylisoborneol synthase
MARYATPAQVHRLCYAFFTMLGSWNVYAAWRFTGKYPPAWKYLVAREFDSFTPSMSLIDVLGGYEVIANLFFETRVRHAFYLAATAAVLVNDLYSVANDMAEKPPGCNMVLQLSAERGTTIKEAMEVTVRLHNQLVRDFEQRHKSLEVVPSVELQRFLRGLRSWMGGSFEWHDSSSRYKAH